MHARWCQHISIVATSVDRSGDLAHGVADRRAGGIPEIEVSAVRGDGLDRGRQQAMLGLELAQLRLGVDAVDIDDEDVRDSAGGDRDIVVVGTPPAINDTRVDRGVENTVSCGRSFGARSDRKHVQATYGQRHCSAMERALHVTTKTEGSDRRGRCTRGTDRSANRQKKRGETQARRTAHCYARRAGDAPGTDRAGMPWRTSPCPELGFWGISPRCAKAPDMPVKWRGWSDLHRPAFKVSRTQSCDLQPHRSRGAL